MCHLDALNEKFVFAHDAYFPLSALHLSPNAITVSLKSR